MLYKIQTIEALHRAKNLSERDKTLVANLVMIEVNTLARHTTLPEEEYDDFVEDRYVTFKSERKSLSEAKGSIYIKSFLSELIFYSHLKGDRDNLMKIMDWVEDNTSNE